MKLKIHKNLNGLNQFDRVVDTLYGIDTLLMTSFILTATAFNAFTKMIMEDSDWN